MLMTQLGTGREIMAMDPRLARRYDTTSIDRTFEGARAQASAAGKELKCSHAIYLSKQKAKSNELDTNRRAPNA